MRTLKLEMQVSVDGFTADLEGRSDWMVWPWSDDWTWDPELRAYSHALLTSSDLLLLSRKMAEEGFHDHWRRIAADPSSAQAAFAQSIVDTPKLVFSRTLQRSVWPGTALARGDLAAEVAALKSGPGKDLLCFGGPTFASALIEADLIDELHLLVNPVVIGRGRSMFKDLQGRRFLKPVKTTLFDCGVVALHYERIARHAG